MLCSSLNKFHGWRKQKYRYCSYISIKWFRASMNISLLWVSLTMVSLQILVWLLNGLNVGLLIYSCEFVEKLEKDLIFKWRILNFCWTFWFWLENFNFELKFLCLGWNFYFWLKIFYLLKIVKLGLNFLFGLKIL